MLIFIINFLKERYIQVRVNNILSKKILIENGVPQGSVISVTLFLIAINAIFKCIKKPVEGRPYADDTSIFCIGNTEKIIQNTLNNLYDWAQTTGFKFSTSKTECMIFAQNQNFKTKLNLSLAGKPINQVNKMKILGVTFDQKLDHTKWKQHIEKLKAACNNKLNILKILAAKNWGADKQILLNTYKSFILPKLDYASIIYSSSRYFNIKLNTKLCPSNIVRCIPNQPNK